MSVVTRGRLRVIDGHVHVGGPAERQGSPEQILGLLASIGAEQAVCLPAPGLEPDNQELDRLLKPHRDRLHPCVWVNPLAGERAVATVRKHSLEGWRILKLQPAMHQFSLLAVQALKVVEEALRHRLLIIIHSGGASVASPWAIGELAGRYPEARMVIDHMGGADLEYVRAAIQVAEQHPGLFLGTSQMPFYRMYAEASRRLGAERLVFGSDAPIVHPLPELQRVLVAGLSDAELKLVLGGNLARLLGLKAKVSHGTD